MTKLWIGLGVLIVIGALFSVLSLLWAKVFPDKETPDETEEPEKAEMFRAVVHCTGGGASFSKYRYEGIKDCLAASLLPGGGPLSCDHGCLGMGTCIKVCPADAIRLWEGVAVVDGERCTACGKCVGACPRHIISLEPFKPKKHVAIPCASQMQGEEITKLCTDGCIGCALCAKACPQEAITVENNLARIDYEKCDNCGQCVSKCPRHLIRMERVEEPPKPEPPKEKKPKRTKGLSLPKMKLPQKPVEEEAVKVEAVVEQPIEEPAPAAEKLIEVDVSKEPTVLEPLPEKAEPAEPAPETPAEEKPADGARSSAEAFKAFEQAVAAVGEALGEKKDEDPSSDSEPAKTKTE